MRPSVDLPEAGLAHQAQHLAALEREADAAHGGGFAAAPEQAAAGHIGLVQVAHVQQYRLARGSRAVSGMPCGMAAISLRV